MLRKSKRLFFCHLKPFVAVGLELLRRGHRVRLATHAPMRSWVEAYGLEFYPLGGDMETLSEFAVRSKGVELIWALKLRLIGL